MTLAALGMGMMAGGQIYGGISAKEEGKAQESIENYNAAVEEQRAKAIELKTEFEQQRQAEAGARIKGLQLAGAGASGLVVSEGAPLLSAAMQASELELENLLIGYEGITEAARARSQAAEYRMRGKLAKQRGKSEMIGKFLEAGGTLLTGFSEFGETPGAPVDEVTKKKKALALKKTVTAKKTTSSGVVSSSGYKTGSSYGIKKASTSYKLGLKPKAD